MKVFYSRAIDCSGMTSAECSDRCVAALGHGIGFKLRADEPDDEVHGLVTIAHTEPPALHEIIVEVYERDELPVEGRESTLRRPVEMPTERTLRDRLDTIS